MTVVYTSDGLYMGLSTDTKTAAPAGYRFFESDTGDWHVSDGTYWWLSSLGVQSNKRIGMSPQGNSNTTGVGMLSVLSGGTGAGSTTNVIDGTNGRNTTYITGTTTGNKSGVRVTAAISTRQHNPRVKIKFQLTDTTLMRMYLGLQSTTEPTGDDPFGAGSVGVVCGLISGSTHFQIMRNDSTGATVFESTGVAVNTSVHTIKIVADEANTRFSWSFDGSAYTHYTTDIPSATNALTYMTQNETNESGVAKTFRVYHGFVQADK